MKCACAEVRFRYNNAGACGRWVLMCANGLLRFRGLLRQQNCADSLNICEKQEHACIDFAPVYALRNLV